ncbi:unnamed protein product [Allacma fusca]|uniref:Cytochrome P450 18a1 n=1 Tax=Allacma fusca TaxID=39272 RepID=A0A8J2PZY5_9HEXA|nr:unnamed protein product [Allacma fusca]
MSSSRPTSSLKRLSKTGKEGKMVLIAAFAFWLRDCFICSDVYLTLLCFTSVLLIVRTVQIYHLFRNLPPGPWGLPFLGFLPFLQGVPHLQFCQLRRRYGSIFSARLGSHLVVVLSDYKTIRKAFRQEAFSARPENEITALMEGYGIINVDGDMWKDQRRFLHERLRSFGMKHVGHGKEQLESRIMVEVETFLQAVAREKGNPCCLARSMTLSMSNVICSMLMSVRFDSEDPRFKRFMFLIEEGFQLVSATGAANFIPCLRNLPRIQELNVKIQNNRKEMQEFFKEIVDLHKATFDPNNIRDMVDTYLLEIELARKDQRFELLFEGKDPDRQIYQIMGDLFSAGMETVKTTLQWSVVYMLHHPDIMKNVQDELDQVVGRNRLPTLEDMAFLPYTEATLLEVLRRSTVVPMGTTHSTTREMDFEGFTIPKNSSVIPLIHAVHMDPKLWDHPEKFDPTRFLSAEGAVTKPEFFMPFGVGRRMCLGDVLARMELFLFFSCLLHVYNLEVPAHETLPSIDGNTMGVTTTPDKFKVCVIPRQIELTTSLENFTEPATTLLTRKK